MNEPDLNHLMKQQQELEDQLLAKFDRGAEIFKKYKLNEAIVDAYLHRPTDRTTGADMLSRLVTNVEAIVAQMSVDELKDYFVATALKDFTKASQGLIKLEEMLNKGLE